MKHRRKNLKAKKSLACFLAALFVLPVMMVPGYGLDIAPTSASRTDELTDYQSMSMQELLALDENLTWVFAGDSITHVAGYTAGMNGYSEYIEQRLLELGRNDDAVFNTAWGGKTIYDMYQDLENYATKYDPDIVFIKMGMNDRRASYADTYAGRVEQFKVYYQKVIDGILEAGKANGKIPKIILISTTPRSSDTLLNQTQYDEDTCWPFGFATQEIAEKNGLQFIDLITAFCEEATVLGDDYHHTFFSDDSDGATHPNQSGQYFMFKVISRELGIYDESSSLYQLTYADLNDAALYPDVKTDSTEVTEDEAEMNKAMATLSDGTQPLAYLDFDAANGTFQASSSSHNGATVDLTTLTNLNGDTVKGEPLTAEDMLTLGYEYTAVVRAKLLGGETSNDGVFYMTTNSSLAYNKTTSVMLGVPSKTTTQFYSLARLNGSGMYSTSGTTFNCSESLSGDGKWHTIVMRQTETAMEVYVDGEKAATQTLTSTWKSTLGEAFSSENITNYAAYFGRYIAKTEDPSVASFGKDNFGLNAYVDYAQFYGTALTDDQIKKLSGTSEEEPATEVTEDEAEMNKAMATLTDGTQPLAYLDFDAANGTFQASSSSHNGATVDLTTLTNLNGDTVKGEPLTAEDMLTLGYEYTAVVRAKLLGGETSNDGIFYMTTNSSLAYNKTTSVMLGVPSKTTTQFYSLARLNGSGMYSTSGTTFNCSESLSGDGKWHTIVMRQTETAMEVYVDGEKAATQTLTSTWKSTLGEAFSSENITNYAAYFGRYIAKTEDPSVASFGKDNFGLNAYVDYAQFYGTALTDDQIKKLSGTSEDDFNSEIDDWNVSSAAVSTALNTNYIWAVAGAEQISTVQTSDGHRSLFRELENTIRYPSAYRSVRMFRAAAPGYTVSYLLENYDELIGKNNPNVLLLLPEVSEAYEDGYVHSDSKVKTYQQQVLALLQKSEANVKILLTPLPSADETVNSYLTDYADAIREIAENNPNLPFYDINAYVTENISNDSLMRNWFGAEMMLQPLGALEFAKAILTELRSQGLPLTSMYQLDEHTYRESTDGRVNDTDYRTDNIEADVSVSGLTATVNISNILAEYPDITNIRFALLPFSGCGNYNENIQIISDVTWNGNDASFTVPYGTPVITIYGEYNGKTYRFRDITPDVTNVTAEQINQAIASIGTVTKDSATLLNILERTVEDCPLSGLDTNKLTAARSAYNELLLPDGVYLDSLSVVGAPAITLQNNCSEYRAELYQYQRTIQILAEAQDGLTISVDEETVASGAYSQEIAVDLEETKTVTVSVSDGASEAVYKIEVTRPAYPDIIVTEVIQNGVNYTYTTASGTNEGDGYDLVEIYNASGRDIDLKDYCIGWNKDTVQTSSDNKSEWPYYFTGNTQAFSGGALYTGINNIRKYSEYWQEEEPDSIPFPADSTMVIWVKYVPTDAANADNDGRSFDTLKTAVKSKSLSLTINGETVTVLPDDQQLVIAEVPAGTTAAMAGARATTAYEKSAHNFYLANFSSVEQVILNNAGGSYGRGWLFILKAGAVSDSMGQITENADDIVSAANYIRPFNSDNGASTILAYDTDRGMSVVPNAGNYTEDLSYGLHTSDQQSYIMYNTLGAIEYMQKPLKLHDETPADVQDNTVRFTTRDAVSIQLDMEDDTDIRYLELHVKTSDDEEYTVIRKDLVLETTAQSKTGTATDILSYSYIYDIAESAVGDTKAVYYYGYVVDGNAHETWFGSEDEPNQITFETAANIAVSGETVEQGGLVDVTVNFTNLPASFDLTAALNIQGGDLITPVNAEAVDGLVYDTQTGSITWSGTNEDSEELITALTVSYRVSDTETGTVKFSLEDVSLKSDGNTVVCNTDEATAHVTIVSDCVITVGSATGVLGQTDSVDVPLTLTENNSVNQLEFCVEYDSAQLQYIGYTLSDSDAKAAVTTEKGLIRIFLDKGTDYIKGRFMNIRFAPKSSAEAGTYSVEIAQDAAAYKEGGQMQLSSIAGSVTLSNGPLLIITELSPDSKGFTSPGGQDYTAADGNYDQFEYLELYNPNDFDVSLSDVGLYYSASGAWGVTPIFDVTFSEENGTKIMQDLTLTTKSVPAHSHFIIWSMYTTEWLTSTVVLDWDDFEAYFNDEQVSEAIREGRMAAIFKPTADALNSALFLPDWETLSGKTGYLIGQMKDAGYSDLPVAEANSLTKSMNISTGGGGGLFNMANSTGGTYYVGDLNQYSATLDSSTGTYRFGQFWSAMTLTVKNSNPLPNSASLYGTIPADAESDSVIMLSSGAMSKSTPGYGEGTASVAFKGLPENASVTVKGYTASNGVYALPVGTYTYSLQADGYKTASGSFTVTSDDLVKELTSIPYSLEKDECVVIFQSNGGSYVAAQIAEANRVTAPAEPTREGYRFAGWSEDPSGGTVVHFPYTVTESTVLTALWEEKGNEEQKLQVSGDTTLPGLQEGYTVGNTLTLTIQGTADTSLTDLKVYLTGSGKDAYSAVLDKTELQAGETALLTITFKEGMTAGTYDAAVTVTAAETAEALTINLSQVVTQGEQETVTDSETTTDTETTTGTESLTEAESLTNTESVTEAEATTAGTAESIPATGALKSSTAILSALLMLSIGAAALVIARKKRSGKSC